jgi:hypothetical protein
VKDGRQVKRGRAVGWNEAGAAHRNFGRSASLMTPNRSAYDGLDHKEDRHEENQNSGTVAGTCDPKTSSVKATKRIAATSRKASKAPQRSARLKATPSGASESWLGAVGSLVTSELGAGHSGRRSDGSG